MIKKHNSIYGDEHVQSLHGFISESKRRNIEIFSTCKIDLIRSNMWKCYAPWFVNRRTLMNDFMIFVFDGSMQVESPSGRNILKRGDFFLSGPGEFHSFGFNDTQNYVEHVLIHCRFNFPGIPFRNNLFSTPFLSLKHPESSLESLKILPYLWGEKSPASAQYAGDLLRKFFIDLVLSDYTPVLSDRSLDLRISEGINYMRNNFQSSISITDIATNVGLSEMHFRKLFRDNTNRSPLDLLTELRLQHACVLLQNSMIKISRVAEECGFNSVDYFCRIFKKHQLSTPSEYRHDKALY